MKSTDTPSLIETVIASKAPSTYVRTIPKTQTKAGSGEMSLALGWPPECAIPVAAGGKYPQMADANGVLKLLSAAVQQLQARFMGSYNADFSTAIGGYPLNAIVSDTKAGQFWVSTAEDNTTVPGDDGASWQSLFAGYATNDALKTETTNRTNADTNLQNQINNRVQKTGDTMSGLLSITVPSAGVAINSISNNNNSGYNDATINFALTKRFGYAASIGLREHVGQSLGIMLSVFNGSSWHEFDLIAQGENQGRMVSPAGVSALTSDLPTTGTITGGTYTKIPMNDGTGRSVLVQSFVVSASDHAIIQLPITLSTTDGMSILLTPQFQKDNGVSNLANYYEEGKTAGGFRLDLRWVGSAHGDAQTSAMNISVIVVGVL